MSNSNLPSVVIFGASGAIGTALCNSYLQNRWHVTAVGRRERLDGRRNPKLSYIKWSPRDNKSAFEDLQVKPQAVIWAQGANISDDIFSYRAEYFSSIFEANVVYIIETLKAMLDANALAENCRMVVVSSIWQEIARNKKLSYTVSKAALRGLVQSLAIDLATLGHQINAVLPGVLDTPMTHANLTSAQIEEVLRHTPGHQITSMSAVCEAVEFLTSQTSAGVNGQFLSVDGGFSRTFIAK